MCTVEQRQSTRMRETQQHLMPSGLHAGFRDQGTGCVLVMHPMATQPGSSKTEHIMSRYRPIAPKPVAAKAPTDPGTTPTDQTPTDTHSVSSLSTDNASTTKSSTESRPGNNKRSRKRIPQEYQPSKAASAGGKKVRKGASHSKPDAGIHRPLAVEFHSHGSSGYTLTPLLPVGVAQKFGPGGLQRFHESFDHHRHVPRATVSLPLPPAGNNFFPPEDVVGLELHMRVGDAAAAPENRDVGVNTLMKSCSVSFGARESWLLGGRPSLSPSAGAESEVCSGEVGHPKSDIVTLSLLPDTPSNVKNHNNNINNTTRSTSSTSTLSLLRSDIRWSSSTTRRPEQPACSSDLNTSLTMSSNGHWWDDNETAATTTTTAPVNLFCERSSGSRGSGEFQQGGAMDQVVDASDLDQRHGGSSEAIMVTDGFDNLLWANAAFQRLSHERMSSRMQAIGPYLDPLGIRTHLATLTFQPPFPAPKCKAVLWGFLKKFILHKETEQTL